jgi:hypothetical protein
MSNDWEIQIGPRLDALLASRKEPLSTVVNMLADRYLGIIERSRYSDASPVPMMDFHAQLYGNVLSEAREFPLSAKDIAAFPAACEDYLKRHPKFPQGPGSTAVSILKNCTYPELVVLVDYMEKYL